MEKLVGSDYKSFQQGLSEEKENRPVNVNISMPESFRDRLDELVADSGCSSRSEYVRAIIRKYIEGESSERGVEK